MSLKDQVERLTERLNPEPPELLTIVLRCFTPIEDPGAIQPPWYVVGTYATATFMGGTEREQRRELRRLRESGEYDAPLGCGQAAIGEGEETTEALPAGRREGNGKALGEGHG